MQQIRDLLKSGGGGVGATAANQATQITAEQAIQATVGATSGAAVITDANGTLQQYLRGLVKLIVAKITVLLDSTQLATLATAAKQDALLAGITKVGAVVVAGISEVDNYTTGATSNHTVAAGAIAIAINFSSDFTGTVQGATYTAANQGVALSRVAQPGNLLPALAVTRSAGSYDYYVVTPT